MPLTTVQSGMMDSTAQYYSFKNRIINGAMAIAQRGTSFTLGANTGGYTLDRWEYNAFSTTGAYSVAQSSTVPNGNFTYSSLLTVTATVTPTGSDYYFYQTKIEGYNSADLGWGTANAQNVTVSFWIRSSVTGTYSFHLINANVNLSYIATFSITAANTWQYVTLTIPGPTTGTWNTTNGVGIYAGIDLGMGASRQTTANTWSSGASFFCGTSSNTQWISNSGATLYITGVQLEKGSTATSFDYRPYGTELALCQRYYWKGGNAGMGIFNSGTTARFYFFFPVEMRAAPDITAIAAPVIINPTVSDGQTGSQTTNFVVGAGGGLVNTISASKVQFGGFTSGVDGRVCALQNSPLQFSAEL